jgi:hypothetical protein
MRHIRLYEEIEIETEISIPDIIDYFTKNGKVEHAEMQAFFMKIFTWTVIKFQCFSCKYNDHGTTTTAHMHKTHKGKITGYGYQYGNNELYLTLHLNRIKYEHEVDVSKTMIVYGKLPNNVKRIIAEINTNRDVKKYNL